MPLTPLPASNTKRYFVGMITNGQQHHFQVRVASTVTDGLAVTNLGFTIDQILPVTFLDCNFNELLVAELGSDIRNPVSGWTPKNGTNALNLPDQDQPLTICARGRSVTGRKTKLLLFGQVFTRTPDWLYTPGAATDHRSFLDILNASPDFFLAIDATKPVWKLNFTIDFNDHWEQKVRP